MRLITTNDRRPIELHRSWSLVVRNTSRTFGSKPKLKIGPSRDFASRSSESCCLFLWFVGIPPSEPKSGHCIPFPRSSRQGHPCQLPRCMNCLQLRGRYQPNHERRTTNHDQRSTDNDQRITITHHFDRSQKPIVDNLHRLRGSLRRILPDCKSTEFRRRLHRQARFCM